MFCPKCGSQIPDGVKFCPKCGAVLKGAAGQTPQRGNSNTSYGQPAPKKSPTGLIIALVALLIVLAVGITAAVFYLRSDSGNKEVAEETTEEETEKETKKAKETTAEVTTTAAAATTAAATTAALPSVEAQAATGPITAQPIQNQTAAPVTAAASPVYIAQSGSGFVFPDSSSRYLTAAEVASHTKDELRIARNEIYARHGRKFTDPALQQYFNSQSWYRGVYDAGAFNDNWLSQLEKDNVKLISSYE